MTEILFSIVIPVYNVEDYLTETVNAILPQIKTLGKNAEILLVDDGSTDGSPVLCDQYAAQYPELIRVFHKENEGLLLTRRFGFRHARGRYIINCDSDDALEASALHTLADTAQTTDADVILYNINIWDGSKKTAFFDNIFTEEAVSHPDKAAVYRAFFHCAGVVSMCAKAFKRSCLDMDKDYSQFYKKSFGEDTLQSAEIYTNAQSFVYLNQALYNYRTSSGMTGKMNPTYFQNFAEVNTALEVYKPLWQLDDFDALVAQKIFANACRAITQVRYDHTLTKKERLCYYKEIRQHDMLCKYKAYYSDAKPLLKRSYRLLAELLLRKQYHLIDLILQAKKISSKNN